MLVQVSRWRKFFHAIGVRAKRVAAFFKLFLAAERPLNADKRIQQNIDEQVKANIDAINKGEFTHRDSWAAEQARFCLHQIEKINHENGLDFFGNPL